ncbi:ParB N-terminal domain-containing protein [Streptomyces sp. NBC_00258]|uniref:ParB N-terminal domain-containing protein n=1 Tax=Streptomyces sp. NBC_00258 TaxID=2903642 RepID=UPI002E2A6833|nr:ParB N-terminal domain-containing protein [Streptomyces sp. NBC_00258]
MVALKYKTIPVGDIRADRPLRNVLGSVDKLRSSIKRNGMRVPLLVNPADLSLISGYRRYAACRGLRNIAVRAALPADVAEACFEMGEHVRRPDSTYALPMTPRERVGLAMRLGELPKPVQPGKFRYEDCIAPTVDISAAILQRIRTVVRAAQEDAPDPDAAMVGARKVLGLMLQAVERPVDGWTTGQTIRLLHALLRAGEHPESLEDVCSSSRVRGQRAEGHPLPSAQQPAGVSPERGVPRQHPFPRAEIRRGIDTISGACAGLESLPITGIPVEEAGYLEREIKKNQRILRRILKCVQES